jgi:hypothetical protein
MKHFSLHQSVKNCSDAGMAAVLIMLLAGLFTGRLIFYQLAIPLLVINMIIPRFFYPFAILWLGLSGFIGEVLSKVILACVYFFVVLPVGFIRRLTEKDPLNLRKFKDSDDSVMVIRDHQYTASDLEKPF